ncbi:MAG: hypothetical protein ABI744_00850 [Chloroflexota bacterium]
MINADVAAGKIDPVTGLLYRAYGLFGLAGLPDEYATGVPRADDALFNEIVDMLPTLSTDDQAKLRPFIVRPTEPDSIFATQPTAVVGELLGRAATQASVTCRDWANSGAADPRFKIWACRDGDASAAEAAIASLSTLVGAIWGPMTTPEPNGMGEPLPDGIGTNVSAEYGGDARIDFYALNLDQVVYREGDKSIPAAAAAAAIPSPPYTTADGAARNSSSGFVLVNRNRLGDTTAMKQDLVHEFFHVLQHAHNRRAPTRGSDSHWFSEASAVWAEIYYVPANSKVPHAWFPDWFQPSAAGLEDPNPDHEYAAYIWPFFMQQEVVPSAVFKAWSAIESVASGDFAGVTTAISSSLSFDTSFRDFAVRNLNMTDILHSAGLKAYPDLDGNFYADVPPGLITPGDIKTSPAYTSPEQALAPLAATYFHLIPAGDAHEVTFDLTTLAQHGTADGDVLLLISNKWEHRPIQAGVLKLCRDEPADAFDDSYLVLSNHGRLASDLVTGQFEVTAKTGCALGHYSIDVANMNGGHREQPGHHEADGDVNCSRTPDGAWTVYAVYFPNDPNVPNRDVGAFSISTTPGHEAVTMTVMFPTTDSPVTWYVLTGDASTFEFQFDADSRPVTFSAMASDNYQTINITGTCSTLALAP